MRLQQGPVVLISSRLGLVCVPAASSHRKGGHQQQARFLRTYARKLPSSLTRDHSSALACSACLPVSVCGTVTLFSRAGLSRQHRLTPLAPALPWALALTSHTRRCYRLGRRSSRRWNYLSVSRAFIDTRGAGIKTCCPSVVTNSHTLRPD